MNDAKRAGGLRQIDNDMEPVTFARTSADERTRISLRHIAAIHDIKSRIIGDSYAQLGEVVWQMLCAVRLSELHDAPFDIAEFGKRFATCDAILQRVVSYLEREGLLCYGECASEPHSRSLALIDSAVAKVDDILEASADAFSASFIYPKLKTVS